MRGLTVLFSGLVFFGACTSASDQASEIQTGEPPAATYLKDLAPEGFAIGAVLHGYSPSWSFEPYRQLINDEFNAVTATAYMPWGAWPERANGPDTTGLTLVTQWAEQNGKRVHGHVLVYPAGNLDLDWFQALPLTEVSNVLETFTRTTAEARAGRIWAWDVVNEVLGDIVELENSESVDSDGIRKGLYVQGEFKPFPEYSAMGADYIAAAFRWAQQADPNAQLIINDYGIEAIGPKSDNLLALANKLRDQGLRVDGIGVQLHWENMESEPDYGSIRENFQRFAANGYRIFFTEVDVAAIKTFDALRDSPSDAQLARQQRIYENLLQIALDEPAVVSFLFWDVADDQSWWHPTRRAIGSIPAGTYMYPTPFWGGDMAGLYPISPKPAYFGMKSVLQQRRTNNGNPCCSSGGPITASEYRHVDTKKKARDKWPRAESIPIGVEETLVEALPVLVGATVGCNGSNLVHRFRYVDSMCQ